VDYFYFHAYSVLCALTLSVWHQWEWKNIAAAATPKYVLET